MRLVDWGSGDVWVWVVGVCLFLVWLFYAFYSVGYVSCEVDYGLVVQNVSMVR